MSEVPAWIIVAPIGAEELVERARHIWRKEHPWADEDEFTWNVVAGSRGYAAVFGMEPGSEGEEESLLRALTMELRAPVFDLWLGGVEDGAVRTREFGPGNVSRDLEEDPFALCQRLGIELGGLTEGPETIVTRSALVVEDVKPEEVARAIGRRGIPTEGPMQIVPNARGVLFVDPEQPMGMYLPDIGERLAASVSYLVEYERQAGRFTVMVFRGLDPVGIYGGFEGDDFYGPPLENILGESSPAGILRVLDIPPEALGM